jgi:hypothetical protein
MKKWPQKREKSEKGKQIARSKGRARNLQNRVAKDFSKITGIPWGKDCMIQARTMGLPGTDIILIGEAKDLLDVAVEAKACKQWSISSFIRQARDNLGPFSDWAVIARRPGEREPIVVMDSFYAHKLISLQHDGPARIYEAKRPFVAKWLDEIRSTVGVGKEWFASVYLPEGVIYFMEYSYYLIKLKNLVERRRNKVRQLRRHS